MDSFIGADQAGTPLTIPVQPSLAPIAPGPVFPYREGMEVHFTPETEKKLNDLAAQTGRATADLLVQDVIEDHLPTQTTKTVTRSSGSFAAITGAPLRLAPQFFIASPATKNTTCGCQLIRSSLKYCCFDIM